MWRMTESALPRHASGGLLTRGEAACYRVDSTHALDPFFVPLVSAGDGWGFVSSTGALTAGRRTAEQALFPYRTDDQLLDSVGTSGSRTVVEVLDDPDGPRRWRPFVDEPDAVAPRALEKSLLSDEVTLEERHLGLGLLVRVSWRFSRRFGLVRTTTLASERDTEVELDVDDGVVDLLPPGAGTRVQRELSTLLDAYKLTELDAATGVAWTRLNAAVTDLAEAAESWRATTMWSSRVEGLHADIRPPAQSLRGEGPPTTVTRGRRAAYRLRGTVRLRPGETRSWRVVLDTACDAAAVADLVRARTADSAGGCDDQLRESLAEDRAHLRRLVASADGEQATGDEVAGAHHTSTVVFNILRGGVPADGLDIRRTDLEAFLDVRRRDWRGLWEDVVRTLPARFPYRELTTLSRGAEDLDLRRLLGEYLPLTFSRRHGDPSRPWNRFEITVADDAGASILRYEGNWRDIIQNWEALGLSFPPLIDPMARVVLDAMTVDGYNPYRISTEGPDWEVPDPDDPWANIGYWSDHQVVYLHQLLRHRHDLLGGWTAEDLVRADLVYADVPYRLAGWREALAGTGPMVTFDEGAHARCVERAARLGGDGLLRVDARETPVRASLIEKLLLVVGAKIVNVVPGHGIWMNTQRPEWNDANNALVGRGVSVVTAAQLRAFVADLLRWVGPLGPDESDTTVTLSAPLVALVERLDEVLATRRPEDGRWTPAARADVMAELGDAGDAFRAAVHGPALEERAALPVGRLRALLTAVLQWLDDAIDTAWQPDGLVTSYGVLEGDAAGLDVRPLGPMLEGQVAVLASGALDPVTAADLVDAVRRSPLWTADRETYLLYPDREVPGFLERARVPEAGHHVELLTRLAGSGDRRLVASASDGGWYFGGDLRNAVDVDAVLEELEGDPAWADLVHRDRTAVLDAFEEAVDHAAYTGRSGTFFAYEGLGSVYWHMVSKYLAAVQAAYDAVPAGPEHDGSRARLAAAVEEVRAGLLTHRSPDQVGAVPIDPYSHTPSGQGARQPGMTGQVKEDIVIRWRDLGLAATDGTVGFRPDLVPEREWRREPTTWSHVDVAGRPRTFDVPADALAFTWCQVPVLYVRGTGQRELHVVQADGSERHLDGWGLPDDLLEAVVQRTGWVTRLTLLTP
jgi:hypothetical protein